MNASIRQSTWGLNNVNLMALACPSVSAIPRLSACSSFIFNLSEYTTALTGYNKNLEQTPNILLEGNDAGSLNLL